MILFESFTKRFNFYQGKIFDQGIVAKVQDYGSTGCEVFKQGYKIRKTFAKKSTYPKDIIEFGDWD